MNDSEHNKGQGEGKRYSEQPARNLRNPYAEGLSSISVVFKVPGKLERITAVGANKTILEINFDGITITIPYRGQIPKTCRRHHVLIYREVKGLKDRIQVWDKTTGRQYNGAFR